MIKQKPIKCAIKSCKKEACAWINGMFVCKYHFEKIKNPIKEEYPSWLNEENRK